MKALTANIYAGCVFLIFYSVISAFAQGENLKPSSEDNFPAFPDDVTPLIPLRSQIPGDFFSPAQGPDRTANRLQHDFDIYSWETFLALCWPANSDGSAKKVDRADPNLTPEAEGYFTYPNGTVWENWMPADAVFREGAKAPIEWGKLAPPSELYGAANQSENRLKVEVDPADSKGIQSLQEAQAKKVRSISWIGANFAGAIHGQNTKTLRDVEQALGTGRLIDNKGYFVRYEVLMNRDVFDFVAQNQLYDQETQKAYVQQGKHIVFPIGKFEVDAQHPRPVPAADIMRPITKSVGSVVVKAGWKRLSKEEYDSGKFYSIKAVTQFAGQQEGKSLSYFGLIALHIIHKSADVAQWTWSTFEHDDNCPDIRMVDDHNADARPYSFFDPLVFNRIGYVDADGYPAVNVLSDLVALPKPIKEPLAERYRSRLVRIVPLTRDVTAINRQFKTKLNKSVWKNYSLVSTQWPLEPAGVFLGRGEIAKKIEGGEKLEPGARVRRSYAELNGDVENYNLGEFAMDPRRLRGALPDRPATDQQLGFPAPRALANSVIETSLQGTITVDENGRPSFRAAVEHGTSSCMHCHGDAKTFGTGRPGDMSFLLSRAKSKRPPIR